MARTARPGRSGPSARPPRKNANALGYAKRKSLKSEALGTRSLADVYEFQQEKVRRGKIRLQLEKDEFGGAGGGDSGSGDEDEDGAGKGRHRASRQPRLVGEFDGDEEIDEDDDEDIDSDEAFEESDNERFAGFSFSSNKKKKSKSKAPSRNPPRKLAEVDLNEDSDHSASSEDPEDEGSEQEDEEEEEEEEGDPDEFLDVLDVLDGRAKPFMEDEDEQEAAEGSTSNTKRADAETEGDEDEDMSDEEADSSDEDEASDEDDAISASDAEEHGDDSALDLLGNFVSGLDAGQKRKAPPDEAESKADADAARPRKRRILPERTEAGAENEFAAHLGGAKLNLDDLLAPLEGQSSNLASLKKSAKVLASTSGKIKTLAAPLPQRAAERLDREAAYEQTKEEVDKWKETMKRIKEAEHLSFPLQAKPAGRTSNLELAAKFKPTTELESAVDRLLKSAHLREDEIAATEALKMNHLSVEEVAARRAELARMRELMFRAEAKAKRVAKIKSKTFRRLRKKERARLAEKLGEGEDDEDDEGARMKREVERARERATLRHKNTGKWAKAMKERGELDEDQRRDINEMLERGEKLRRKIRGEGSGDEESDDDDSDADGTEDGGARIKAKAFEELEELAGDEDVAPAAGPGRSVFEMKFMKDAMARQMRKADEEMDDFVRELGDTPLDGDGSDEPGVEQTAYGAVVQRTGGRVVYRPGALNGGIRPVGSLASDTSSVTLKSTDLPGPPDTNGEDLVSPPLTPAAHRPVPSLSGEAANPWLAGPSTAKALQTKHEVVVSKTSAAAEKSKNKLRKRTKARAEEKDKAKDDAAVDIEMSATMTLSTSASVLKPAAKRQAAGGDGSDSDENSELDEQERAAARKAAKGKGKATASGAKAFGQRDLVKLAFAGDNVVQDFAEAKRREMQEDAPKEVDTTLPGWGSWGGTGTKKAPPKPFLIKKVAGIDPASRADYKKAHVFISEKRDKNAAKYLVKDLPFPYTSKAQFERSMETPLGTEWNTRLGFQRATLPKVVTKMGTVISPLEKLT